MKKETGTAKELNVKPGDVVEFVECESEPMSVVNVKVLPEGSQFPGQVRLCLSGYAPGVFNDELFRIISRASDDTPKIWRDMTDEERGGILLAYHEGKVVEYWTPSIGWRSASFLCWIDGDAYRVKPEPVRETFTHTQWVSMHGNLSGGFSLLFGPAYPEKDVEGQTTIETVDGKPVKVMWEADGEKAEEL